MVVGSGQQVFDPLELERLFDSQATTIDDITEEWFLLTQKYSTQILLHSAISKEEDVIELQGSNRREKTNPRSKILLGV